MVVGRLLTFVLGTGTGAVLSVGDGLVTQIPALIVSTASGQVRRSTR